MTVEGLVLGVDPGPSYTAFVAVRRNYQIVELGKVPNASMLGILDDAKLTSRFRSAAIEMIASYGMPVGREVFETCVWIGRFIERLHPLDPTLVFRREVKLNLCGSAKAKDGNVRQALVDRFTPGQPNHGKGTGKVPGWFYGVHDDIWAAYGVAVTHLDSMKQPSTTN